MAKLAGVLKSAKAVLHQDDGRDQYPTQAFPPSEVERYFDLASAHIDKLTTLLPSLYGDFPSVDSFPDTPMANEDTWFSRAQLNGLVRDIEQIFEIRAHSELASPVNPASTRPPRTVFITHGRSPDWREVQSYVEKDIKLDTRELAQQPGSITVIEKLERVAGECDSAVIVMTGDDIGPDGVVHARENVMHEIGYFQAKYTRQRVFLLHEDGVSIPSNLSGIVYIPFPKGNVLAAMGLLARELKHIYGL